MCTLKRLFKLENCSPSNRFIFFLSPSILNVFHSLKRATYCSAPATYDPDYLENRWPQVQCTPQSSCSTPGDSQSRATFSMVLPPPNVTGKLHLGHALTLTIQDTLVRWRSMYGDRVVWVPGTDHAGIATQAMVERHLWSTRRIRRDQLSRDEFVDCVHRWRAERQSDIRSQIDRLCVSLDWSKQFFTLDPRHCAAVDEAFIRLYDMGLIYRSQRIVNWCCRLRSVISDVEVQHRSCDTTLYDIAYCWQDAPDVQLVVSTTRPETVLADCAVAVHPMDVRYTRWQGRKLLHPLLPHRSPLPVVADDAVEPEFGTGVVKITPAHDAFDFALAGRHGLPSLCVFADDGSINEHGGEQFQGVSRERARATVLEALRTTGALRAARPHAATVPVCSRTGDTIEPMLKQQWYLNCDEMARRACGAVESGELLLDPPCYVNVWKEWLGNIRDWCVSRQLWWGHRIPVYRVTLSPSCPRQGDTAAADEKLWVAARSRQEALQKLGVDRSRVVSVQQDEDVLDTWFSSALIPFAAFGWPKQTAELSSLFPLSLMETGHDILFFWVARMVMLSHTLTGQLPFKRVLLHGLICDADGHKMSKSTGNVIDPDDIIDGASLESLLRRVEKSVGDGVLSETQAARASSSLSRLYPDGLARAGCDALRWALCCSDFRGLHVSLNMSDVSEARLFCNKVWQATRFVTAHAHNSQLAASHSGHSDVDLSPDLSSDLTSEPVLCWARHCLAVCVSVCRAEMQSCRLHLAARAIDTLVYRQFCDVVLEAVKPVLRSEDLHARRLVCRQLLQLLHCSLQLLQPFMPRLSCHLLHELLPFLPSSASADSKSMQPGPDPQQLQRFRNDQLSASMHLCLDIVRRIRHEKKARGSVGSSVTVFLDCSALSEHKLMPVVSTLARCQALPLADGAAICDNSVQLSGPGWRLIMNIEVGRDQELNRIAARRRIVHQKLDNIDAKIGKKSFARKSEQTRTQILSKRAAIAAELDLLSEQERAVLSGEGGAL